MAARVTAVPTEADSLVAAARALVLDRTAAQAVNALSRCDIKSVLLKGPAIATWLYTDGESRPYTDVDLLVSPDHRDEAKAVLAELGFTHPLADADPAEYGEFEIELTRGDGACIDLHHSLIGVHVTPEECWESLARHTVPLFVAGEELRVLDLPARTLHLALHAAQNGPGDLKAVRDLERGIAHLPVAVWQEAHALARSLRAIDAFAGGLMATPSGLALARALDVDPPRDVEVLLRVSGVPQEALQLQRLVEEPSMTARICLVARKAWATEAYMHSRFPASRRSRSAMLVARLGRLRRLPRRFLTAAAAWYAAWRASGSTYPPQHPSPLGRSSL